MNTKKLILTILISIIISIIIIFIGYTIKKNMTNVDTKYTNNTKNIYAKDGKSYKVHNFNDANDAANALAEMNSVMVKLIAHLKYKYVGRGYQKNEFVSNYDKISAVNNILNRYNPDNLVENSPNDKIDTSYTLNKGSTIAFCLREKNANGDLHDINTLIFVAIHELVHIAIDDNDHPPIFWKTFKWLLQEAELGNIYFSQDYQKNPVKYCGMGVNYNPLYDDSV
jgi:hypothetical protein